MLPIRFIAESLGATVEWNEASQQATITSEDKKTVIVLTIGSKIALVNGQEVEIDVEAFTENDRTYLPVRFISENLNTKVEWSEDTQQVTITK